MAADQYTHGHQDSVLRSHRWRTAANSAAYLLPHLRAGMRLLDVGCGPGTLTVDLAAQVAPGDVVGIDVERSVVDEARQLAAERRTANVSFQAGDFRTAGLSEQSFDVVHAHQVLQHLRDPIGALQAMAALARPEGLVAARDSDYEAMTWAPADERLDRWLAIYMAVTRRNGAEANAGRHLLRWAEEAGLRDVSYTTSTWTFASPTDRQWWGGLWAERIEYSTLASQAVEYGIASPAELAEVAAGWRRWAAGSSSVFIVVHGELIGRPAG